MESDPVQRSFIKAVLPYLNRTTFGILLALATTFGIVAPERATQLRDIVMMLPAGTGDLFN